MKYTDSYNDICSGIEIHEQLIEAIDEEMIALNKILWGNAPSEISAICYSGMPGGGKNYTSFDRLIDRAIKLSDRRKLLKNLLDNLKKQKDIIDSKLKELKGLQHKVAYMKDVDGKSLNKIAEELNYSYQYIREVYASTKPTNNIQYDENEVV